MKRVHLFIDNLSIGGFQRLCLDQAYAFSELGYSVSIHSLSLLPAPESRNFLAIEKDFINKFRLSIDSLTGGHFKQITKTVRILRNYKKGDAIISHSLRATVIIRIASTILLKKIIFVTEIHQLPTLSAPIQRFRRFLYAQCSPILVAYSEAVKKDWDSRVKNFPTPIRFFFNKQIEVLRNGIFLDRIPSVKARSATKENGRLIFLGRNTNWKGMSTFLSYAELPSLSHFDLLVMLPEIDNVFEREIRQRFRDRVEIQIGKSVASFVPRAGDVHFYAAQYGGDANFIESVSLNCLEMAGAGVPSAITSNGLDTWADLKRVGIFVECDWSDLRGTSMQILEVAGKPITLSDLAYVRTQISIQANVGKLIQRVAQV
jgi:hypothetical protein